VFEVGEKKKKKVFEVGASSCVWCERVCE